MLVSEGRDRNPRLDLSLAVMFAAVAGAVNSAGLVAYGVFAANMTGNASSLSDKLVLLDLTAATRFAALILSFVLGSCLAASMIWRGRRLADRRIYLKVVGVEAVLLTLIGLADIGPLDPAQRHWLVFGLACLMGWQNATTTLISDFRVRTTHISGMATDIGIAIAAGRSRQTVLPLIQHSATLLAFVLGGVAGVLLYHVASGCVFIVAGAALAGSVLLTLRQSTQS